MRSKSAGFTLIEVLVAVAILAIALLAITRSISIVVQENSYLREKTLAQWVAVDLAAQVKTGLINTENFSGIQNGTENILNATFVWHISAASVIDLPAKQITITIYDQSEKKQLTTLVLYVPNAQPQLMTFGLSYR